MRRLRPWIFCLIFFILANIWIERYFSVHGSELYSEQSLKMRATYRTELEIRKLLKMIADDPAPKVVIIGDSFLWGTKVYPSETASEALKKKLQEKYPDLHVWNIALPASHAADVYALLKVIIPMKPVALIVNTNYYFFSVPEDMNHMTYKWLLPVLEDEPDYKQLLKGLHLNPIELTLKNKIQSWIPVYRHKEELNLKLLGQPLGQDYIMGKIAVAYTWVKNHLPFTLPEGKETEESYRDFYDPHIIKDDQINVVFSKKIANLLDQSGIPTYLFSTPQNPNILGSLIENEIFDANMKMIDQIFANRSFMYENLHGKIDPKYQQDNIHLTKEGNLLLADLLYKRLEVLLAGQEGGATP